MPRRSKTLRLDRDETGDAADLKEVVDFCNMAASFFYEDRLGREPKERGEGIRAISVLSAGQALEYHHLERAVDEINAAMVRLRGTEPNQFLPAELKDKYIDNLTRALQIVVRWRGMIE